MRSCPKDLGSDLSGMRRRSLASSCGEQRDGDSTVTINGVPEEFELLSRTSPLVDLLGPFYARGKGGNLASWGCMSRRSTRASVGDEDA
jgi:hypothetical protein